ncbi:MAG: anthrone oxygenase family protein [Pseudomonadota bacterium]|nr:anthrone oxygenase family protein [Pseudomonadota bacterium]
MREHAWTTLLVIAAVGSGLSGGLFFIFSNTIMRSFDALPAAAAVAAMNSINRVILNPLFFLAFFGTALLCVGLLFGQMSRPAGTGRALVVAGALSYLVGSIGVTLAFNVPLNNKLQAVLPAAVDMEAQWRAYRGPWTQWNHVRAVACLSSAAMFALAVSC